MLRNVFMLPNYMLISSEHIVSFTVDFIFINNLTILKYGKVYK